MRLLFTDTDSVMVQIFELQDLQGFGEVSAAVRAKAIKVMGQLGKLGDETFPARILEWACAPRCTASSRSSPTARARRSAQDQGRAEEGGDQRPASRVQGGAGGRQRAQGSLRAAAQPRARDRRGDRREEVALALQRQGLRPRRSQLAPAGTLAQPGAAADAGRLRSARLRALRPRDGVPRGAPTSGARSDTALVFSPSRFLDNAFSIRRSCSR